MSKFEVIEGGKKDGGGKEKEIPLERKKIIDNSKIESPRIFTRNEIVALISDMAKKEGFKKKELVLDREIYDTHGNLLLLDMKVSAERARASGWGNIWYSFHIKGDVGATSYSFHTIVERLYAPAHDPDNPVDGGIVAVYNEKKETWKLSPGSMSPVVPYGIRPKIE